VPLGLPVPACSVRRRYRVPADPFTDLPPDQKQLINGVCERFELAAEDGGQPRVEEYLDSVLEAVREPLFRELLLLECMDRLRRNGSVSAEELVTRFHGCERLIEAVIERAQRYLLREKAGPSGIAAAAPRGLPDAIGRFKIKGVLGIGGFGVVYLAYDPERGCDLALKIPHIEALLSPELRRRFLREAETTAALDHPNLVKVREVGEAGLVCYIASEYVPGTNLTAYLERYRERSESVPLSVAARLVEVVARAVHYANKSGVLHCDLKPANILLPEGQELSPLVTDFGLARLIGDSADLTGSGQLLGTPLYMAPEQAAGERRALTERTDVYALGAILYELLVGRPPFPPGPAVEVLHRVRYEEPGGVRAARPEVPRELEAVCLKCLEKSPGRRYATAVGLAEDLERFLAGQRTIVRPRGVVSRGVRLSRRHPVATLVIIAALGTLIGVAYHLMSLHEANENLSAALGERDTLVEVLEGERGRLRAEGFRLRQQLYPDSIRRAWQLADRNERVQFLRTLDECVPRAGEEDLRGFEWFYLRQRCERGIAGRLECGHTGIYALTFAPNGQTFAASLADGRVLLCSADSMRVQVTLTHPDQVNLAAYSPEGTTIATACDDGNVRLWSVQGHLLATLTGQQGKVRTVAFSSDGRTLASGGDDGKVHLWSVADFGAGPRVVEHPGGKVKGLAFLDGEKTLVSAGEDGRVRFLRVTDGHWYAHFVEIPGSTLTAIAVSAGERRLAAANGPGLVQVWERDRDGADSRVVGSEGGFQSVRDLAFSPDGQLLAIACDLSVQVWTVQPLARSAVLNGHEGRVWTAQFHPKGRKLFTAGVEGVIRCWELGHVADPVAVALGTEASRFTFLPRFGGILVPGADTAWVTTAPLSTRPKSTLLLANDRSIRAVSVDLSGVRGTTIDDAGNIDCWDFNSLPAPVETARTQAAPPLQVRRTRLLNLAERHKQLGLTANRLDLSCFAVDRDLVVEPSFGEVRVWDVRTGRLVYTLSDHRAAVPAVAFGPGDRLATGSHDRTVRLWDRQTGRSLGTCTGHMGGVSAVAFSPDGRFLASGSTDRTVRLWDTTTYAEKFRLLGHRGIVLAVAFSPDGKTLASAAADGTVRLWHTGTGQELLELSTGRAALVAVAFSPDGRQLAALSASADWQNRSHLGQPQSGSHPDLRSASADWQSTLYLWDARLGTAAD
jgi:WD40 repeat protein